MNQKYIPECLRIVPKQKSRSAGYKRKKVERELAEIVLIEAIQRLKAVRRSRPREWERALNSAITSVELFMAEIRNREWAGIEGADAVVNPKFTTESSCTCGPGSGCTNCATKTDGVV